MTAAPPADCMDCPKCGAISGDDWTQCESSCPMPGSPHYDGTSPGGPQTEASE